MNRRHPQSRLETVPLAAQRDVVGVAVDVLAAGREPDPLDVVAVEVVDRAAQRAEPELAGNRDAREHGIGRRAALDPQRARLGASAAWSAVSSIVVGARDRRSAMAPPGRRAREPTPAS